MPIPSSNGRSFVPARFNVESGMEAKDGGEGGIRTHGRLPVSGFQDRRIRPLCHLSRCACDARAIWLPGAADSRKTRSDGRFGERWAVWLSGPAERTVSESDANTPITRNQSGTSQRTMSARAVACRGFRGGMSDGWGASRGDASFLGMCDGARASSVIVLPSFRPV